MKQRWKESLAPDLKSLEWHSQVPGRYEEEPLKKSEKWSTLSFLKFTLGRIDWEPGRRDRQLCRNLKKKQGKITVRLQE